MGQKTNPIGLRLGVNKQWSSVWFDEQNYAERLHEDAILRKYLFNKLRDASVSQIEIFRTSKKITINIHDNMIHTMIWLKTVAIAAPSIPLSILPR